MYKAIMDVIVTSLMSALASKMLHKLHKELPKKQTYNVDHVGQMSLYLNRPAQDMATYIAFVMLNKKASSKSHVIFGFLQCDQLAVLTVPVKLDVLRNHLKHMQETLQVRKLVHQHLQCLDQLLHLQGQSQ